MGLLFDHFVSYWVTAGSQVGYKIRWKLYRRGRGGIRVSYFGVAVSDDGKEQSERMSKSRWRQGTLGRRSAGYKRAAIANKISVTGIISIIAWWAWKCRRDDNDWLVNHSYVIHIGETNLLSAPPPAPSTLQDKYLQWESPLPSTEFCANTSTTYVQWRTGTWQSSALTSFLVSSFAICLPQSTIKISSTYIYSTLVVVRPRHA